MNPPGKRHGNGPHHIGQTSHSLTLSIAFQFAIYTYLTCEGFYNKFTTSICTGLPILTRKMSNLIFTARKRSFGQGNIFTSVCLSTGGGVPCPGGSLSGVLYPGDLCPGVSVQGWSLSWRGSPFRETPVR